MTHHHHHHHHHHGGGAEQWAHLDEPGRDEWQQPEKLVAALALAPGMVVADVGAGTGYLEADLSRAVGPTGRVLALDANPNLVEHVTKRCAAAGLTNVETRLLEHDSPGLAADSVDRVVILDLWHHLHDRVGYGRAIHSALRSGGRLLVIDRDGDAPHAPPPQMRITRAAVLAELETAGFSVRELPALPRQFVVEAQPLRTG